MTNKVPASPEDITPDWLTHALQASGTLPPGTAIRDLSKEAVGVGIGLLCQLSRLALDYTGERPAGAPASLVAKLPSADAQTRQVAAPFKFYEREVRFYAEIAEAMDLSTPRCFASAFDPQTDDFVLLLEDLGAQRLGDQVAGATAAEARLLTATIAAHHAAYWNDPRLARLDWIPHANSPLNRDGLAPYQIAAPAYLEQYGDETPAAVASVIERLGPRINDILDRFSEPGRPQTICHGDYRLDNVFFADGAPGQPPVTVIDWQIAIRNVGTYDLGYFTSQSLDVGTRRDHETELLRLYHETLRSSGVEDYSYDDLIDDYRWTLLFCLVYPVISVLTDPGNERGLALNRAMMERCTAAIADWDAGSLI